MIPGRAFSKPILKESDYILNEMRVTTTIVLLLAIAFVMISPISELDAAVHHHRSHHGSSVCFSADLVMALAVGSLPPHISHKPVPERALTSRQPALLRC